MRKVYRNPLADTDPYAEPYLTGSAWWDFGFGPLCRRLLAKYGVALPTEQAQRPAAGPGAGGPLTPEIIAERLALNPRTVCADCGCEEGCIDYVRDAATGAAATGAGVGR